MRLPAAVAVDVVAVQVAGAVRALPVHQPLALQCLQFPVQGLSLLPAPELRLLPVVRAVRLLRVVEVVVAADAALLALKPVVAVALQAADVVPVVAVLLRLLRFRARRSSTF